ncbi:MAG: aldehyde dehydrogenase (NADP(+)), partial [Bacteroidota bacterium]
MLSQLNSTINLASEAFKEYSQFSSKQKAVFLRAIATEIEALGNELIQTTMAETNLPEARLLGERGRTCGQLRMFADLVEEGSWVEARIDNAMPDRQPLPRVDIRKMLQPIGPVAVFAASNFPFAFSTAGGDTASALAAGCPVVMKGHSGHIKTSEMVTTAILKAAESTGMPKGVFAMVLGPGAEVGKALVEHPVIKAVGFTGSFGGGMALFHLANARKEPIPVFSEMGSINPVVLMPEKLQNEAEAVAKLYASSITQGVGQFCTNPGLILGVENSDLSNFIHILASEIEKIAPASMLNTGIYTNYVKMRDQAVAQQLVDTEAVSTLPLTGEIQGVPTVASVSGDVFLENPTLHQEVFGPYSLVVKCKNIAQLEAIIAHLEGQLTAT